MLVTTQGGYSPAKPPTMDEDAESDDQDASLFEGDPTIYCSHCAHRGPRRGMGLDRLIYKPSSAADCRASAALSCSTTSSMASKSKNLLQRLSLKDQKEPSTVWTENTISWPTKFVHPAADNGVYESIAAFEQACLFNALTALAYLDAVPGSTCRFPKELINLLPRILCLASDELLFSGSNLAIPPRRKVHIDSDKPFVPENIFATERTVFTHGDLKPQSLIIQGEDAGLLSLIDFDQAGFFPSYVESVQGPFTATTHSQASFWSTRKTPQSSSASSDCSLAKERRKGIRRLFPSSKSSTTATSSPGVGYSTMRGRHPCPYPVVNYHPTKRTPQIMDYAEPDDEGPSMMGPLAQQGSAQSVLSKDGKGKTPLRNSTFSMTSSVSLGSGPKTQAKALGHSLDHQRGALLLRTTLTDPSGWTRFLSSYNALDRSNRSKGASNNINNNSSSGSSVELFEANDLHKHRGIVNALVGVSKTLQNLVVALESGATVLTSEQLLDVIESKRQVWLTERQEQLVSAGAGAGAAGVANSEDRAQSQLFHTSKSAPQLLATAVATNAATAGCSPEQTTPSKSKFFKTLLKKMKKQKMDPSSSSSSSSASLSKEPAPGSIKPASTAVYRPVRTSEDNIYYTTPGVQRPPLVCELPDHVAYGTYSGGPCSPGSPPPVEGGPVSPRIVDSRMLGTMAAPDLPAYGIRLTNQDGTLTLAQIERQRIEKEEADFWSGIEGHCDGVRLGQGKKDNRSAGVALLDMRDLERNLEVVEKYIAKIESQALKYYESAKKG
ncbi:hypothetical protein BGZ72_007150 [Mortierella alpina]|nr:hypothetical protein BGZ72_007150 [Mortierella alpina]